MYILFFKACAQMRTATLSNLLHTVSTRVPNEFFANPRLQTALIDAFMKTGDVSRAQSLFEQSKKKVLPMHGAMMTGALFLPAT